MHRVDERMTIKDFLASATLSAVEHIKCTIKSKNKADYQKLKKIFDSKWFEAKNFDDTELDVCDFDWQSLERDRNWWWQLQALPFLNWFTNSLELQSDAEIRRYFSMCLDSISCWVSKAKENKKSPLVWHDHATAFRLRNLANWLLFCHSRGLPVGDDARTESLADLVVEHLDWLQKDDNYSKFTNHGFDQAMVALTIGLMFDREDFELYRQQNRERLKGEVTFAFTEEGVHKENSPGYQKMMLGRLKQLRTLAPLGEEEISELGESYIENAEAFLKAITLPNGSLPLIGDTRGSDTGLLTEMVDTRSGMHIYDYSKSGYVIFKGIDGVGKDFFVLLKGCHFSNYHRHDDDLMLYVFYDGKVVFGDGGLLNHNEKDPMRIFLRSHFAHSTPYINQKVVRNRANLIEPPSIKFDAHGAVVMSSFMFGEEVQRCVNVSYQDALAISVKDSRVEVGADEIFSNFFLHDHRSVVVGKQTVSVRFDTFSCAVESDSAESIRLLQGWGGKNNSENAIFSPDYGRIEDACRIVIGLRSGAETIVKMTEV